MVVAEPEVPAGFAPFSHSNHCPNLPLSATQELQSQLRHLDLPKKAPASRSLANVGHQHVLMIPQWRQGPDGARLRAARGGHFPLLWWELPVLQAADAGAAGWESSLEGWREISPGRGSGAKTSCRKPRGGPL